MARVFLALSWLPPALLIALMWEARRQEAWGAWALVGTVAPFLIGLSGLMAAVGLALLAREYLSERPTLPLLVATLAAASPGIWFCARVVLT
jgi:hypothetical protein